jgi:MFS family permease
MDLNQNNAPEGRDGYLFGPREAWFAFAMTAALMVFDYVDRQVIVSLFPFMKAEWGLSDTQLGALVSVVSVTVALGAMPIALFADRASRVRSIVVMGVAWSLATISCMFTRNYAQLLAARALVGVGEAGYGSVGGALIASHFPSRLRSALMAGFFACASIGSVLGVMLGGIIATHWGWKAAFGVVGVPGLLVALLYLRVRDYRTIDLTTRLDAATRTTGTAARTILRGLTRSPTMLWVCIGAAAQVAVVSTVWAWLPSFLQRVHGIAPDKAAVHAAGVVLCGALGSVLWGAVVDRAGAKRPRRKLFMMIALCLASMLVLATAFGQAALGLGLGATPQYALIALGGFLMTCTIGPVAAVVIDVVHPGVRATGASVLALFQNLFGLAAGPFIAGLLSDLWGLQTALAVMPVFSVFASLAFVVAARSYEEDARRAGEPLEIRGAGCRLPAGGPRHAGLKPAHLCKKEIP